MTATRTADTDTPASPRPVWLREFARVRLGPDERSEFVTHGGVALVYVIEGVAMFPDGQPQTDRALPRELVCGIGLDPLIFVNDSQTEDLTVCQWALGTDRSQPSGLTHRYFSDDDKPGGLCQIAGPDGDAGAIAYGVQVQAWAATLGNSDTVLHTPAAHSSNWLHVIDGSITANGRPLASGESALLKPLGELRLTARLPSQILLLEGRD